jgi:2Fe-2S ferredoxin
MSLITILPSGKTIDAAEGMTLLAAILAADETLTHKCNGNASCGSCHVFGGTT